MNKNGEKSNSIWGPELILISVLPLVVVMAIVATIWIARDKAFTPDTELQTTRFPQPADDES